MGSEFNGFEETHVHFTCFFVAVFLCKSVCVHMSVLADVLADGIICIVHNSFGQV